MDILRGWRGEGGGGGDGLCNLPLTWSKRRLPLKSKVLFSTLKGGQLNIIPQTQVVHELKAKETRNIELAINSLRREPVQ